MKCPKCRTENPESKKFCRECGAELQLTCTGCGADLLPEDKFCGECGQKVAEKAEAEKTFQEAEAERKHVTVLFSDLAGYTAMNERLDPEEVKEIMGRIFGEIAQVVAKYEGFIEKFVGDAVMAIFGVPKTHEDDPVRAIKAAMEIHEMIEGMSPQLEERAGTPLSMHSGINTGLVVTGEVDTGKGTHGLTGDTINTAARFQGLAQTGEILVGQETYRQTEGYFNFEQMEPTTLKGKAEPVSVYRMLSPKEQPETLRRLSGMRADLIGRNVEMAQLKEAVKNIREGKGRIFSISGDAGTGKSRLVRELRASLNLEETQWLEGHAYAYARNIPYFPLIDLLNRVFEIEEGDPPEKVKEKIESGAANLVGNEGDIIPYIGSLYALTYRDIEDVNPELWKSRLRDAISRVFSALSKNAPTIFCLEDLHWADPSFVELLRHLLLEIRQPAVVLCVYRQTFSLFTSHQLQGISKLYQEIRLQDLSPSDTRNMLESLLKTEGIPSDLQRFVQDKAEGNPFYLEELINSLIESGMLIRDNGTWRVTESISESEISSTIQGVISGRLDRLEKEAKRILQEASVIGRAFLYDILKRVTALKDQCDGCLSGLERQDIIKTRSVQPELEYVFKHTLTQEDVYNGLLKKEREDIHERIAFVMEDIFHDRLPEFYETLAFHFFRSRSTVKAVEYLVKSGKKSLARYAVEEADQYFREAFDILRAKTDKSDAEKAALIDMLNEWGYVYYYLGDFSKWIDLLTAHKALAESFEDKTRLGMFYGWMGIAYHNEGSPKVAYDHLTKALNLGEESKDQKVIGYACAWLTWSCTELARYDEAASYGERAQQIAKSFPSDQYLYFKSLAGLGYKSWFTGDIQDILEIGRRLLSHGERHANSRSKVFGHWMLSFGQFNLGEIPLTIKSAEKAIEVSEDPFYIHFGRLVAGLARLISGELQEAEAVLQPVVDFSEKRDSGSLLLWAYMFLGPVFIAQGRMNEGMQMLEKARKMITESGRKGCEVFYEYIMGKIYSLTATGPKPSLSTMAKNIGFLVKNVPVASRKTVEHFNRAIEISKKIGARGPLGLAYLDLGLFCKSKKENDQARSCLSEAVRIFEENGAEIYLKQAKEALVDLR
ncbi:MAG: AAA family ATPase [Deltaproteobacteria bacterium]|nr:AAA family ATPase [Deltaproteobacteria bacterium]